MQTESAPAATAESLVAELVEPHERAEALELLRRCATPQSKFDLLSFLLARREGGVREDEEEVTPPDETQFTNTEFKCPSCGKRQCTTWEKQTRSLDEGATLFAKCVCGRVWRPAS